MIPLPPPDERYYYPGDPNASEFYPGNPSGSVELGDVSVGAETVPPMFVMQESSRKARLHESSRKYVIDQTSPTLFPRTRANNYVKKELTRIYTKEALRVPVALQTDPALSPIKSSARVTAARWEQENKAGPSDGGQWIFDPFVDREKPEAQKLPASRDDIVLLTKSYDSTLMRWARQLPQSPDKIIAASLAAANVQKFLTVLQPELKISMVVEKELIKQMTVVCHERGALAARLFRRYRRYVKGLITLSKNIQMQRAKVQEFIPQVQANRKILMNAVDELESQARKAIETEDLLDWAQFEELCKVLSANDGDLELPTLRRLEKCIVELQTGRSRLEQLHKQERKKLLDLEQIIADERIQAQEMTKMMRKKLEALEHQDGVTSSIRENRIQLAVTDAFNRANDVAASTIDRLEQDKARLHMAVLTVRKQMAQYKFENDKETWDFGGMCTPELMAADIAENAAKEKGKKKSGEEKGGKVGKKNKAGDKKGIAGGGKKKANSKKNAVSNEEMEALRKKVEAQAERIAVLEAAQKQKDNKIRQLEEDVLDLQMNPGTVQNKASMATSDSADRDTTASMTASDPFGGSAQPPPSRPDTPTNMEDAETQYDEEDTKVVQVVSKKKNESGRKRRPGRAKGAVAGKSADLAPIPPDPEADIKWAARWFSFLLCKTCAEAPLGIGPKEPFIQFARRVLITTLNSQGFGDLILAHLAVVTREHAGENKRMHHFGLLLGTKSFPRVDDGSVDLGEETMAEEWCQVVVCLINMLSCDASRPMLPESEDSGVPIGHALTVVPILMKRLAISPTAIAAIKKVMSEEASGRPSHTTKYDTILDTVKAEWLSQFGRRFMQSSARYSMATKDINMYDCTKASHMICTQEKLDPHAGIHTYLCALGLMRSCSSLIGAKTTTTRNPSVDQRQFIGAILRSCWLMESKEPRWVVRPEEPPVTDEDDLYIISDSWLAMKRRMTDLFNKCDNQGTLRKYAVRMRIELADALSAVNDVDEDEIVDEKLKAEDRFRMWELFSAIGATMVNQDGTR